MQISPPVLALAVDAHWVRRTIIPRGYPILLLANLTVDFLRFLRLVLSVC
jgi:hypothetical protein